MLKKILAAAALVIGATPAYAADSFNVYVGYADNLRASGFFPSPFCLTQNTTTCQVDTTATLDSGAFRIDNTGTTSLAISGITVSFPDCTSGPCTYSLWSNFTLAPGAIAIFGQTNTDDTQFDTSDISDFFDVGGKGIGINGIGGCTVASDLTAGELTACTAHDPVISFSENGTPVSLTDTGSILNTGGEDFVNYSLDGNESINWNLIGGGSTRGGSVPEPITLSVFGAGLAGAAALRRRKKKSA
jgi:PEP-CTERM motif